MEFYRNSSKSKKIKQKMESLEYIVAVNKLRKFFLFTFKTPSMAGSKGVFDFNE